jgi:hypothetical protein
MATAPSPTQAATRPQALDEFIESQVRKTQNCVRLVEVVSAMMTVGAMTLAYLLLGTILDHWFFHGGLSVGGRIAAFLVLLACIVAYVARTVLPHVRSRINPVYAASTIERASPSLKNSLINFLLLRRSHVGVPEVVYRGLEQQTAAQLSRVSAEATVDRSRMMRIAYVLIGLFVAVALYTVLSPKSLFPSAGRVFAPWADISAVTRVEIKNVKPGDDEAVLSTQIRVSCEVRGLKEGEQVKLVYSSTNQQSVNIEIPMFRENGELAHSCLLPDESVGLEHDLSYRIVAGDCVTQSYQITVVDAPTIQVTSVEFHYPAYTELESRRVDGVGDIKAIDGTEVIIRAEASQDIARANMHLEGIREQSHPMTFEGRAAVHRLKLRRKVVGDDSIPELTAYRLQFETPRGNTNQNPVRHRILIKRDRPPMVEIVVPMQPERDVAANSDVYIQVRAFDPDFRLSGMRLVGRKDGRTIFDEDLLRHKDKSKQLEGAQRATFLFKPSRYGLKAGDVVAYQAVAFDNKTPTPNRGESDEKRLRITEPLGADVANPKDDQKDKQDQRGDDQNPAGSSDDQGEKDGQQGAGGGGEQSDDKKGDTGGQGGESDASDANQDASQQGDKPKGDGHNSDNPSDQPMEPSDSADGNSGQDSDPKADPTNKSEPGAKGDQNSDGSKSDQPKDGSQAENSDGQQSDEQVDSDGDAFQELLDHLRETANKTKKPGDSESQPSDKPTDGQEGDQTAKRDDSSKGTAGESNETGSDSGGEDGGGKQSDNSSAENGDKQNPKPDNQPGDEKKPGDMSNEDNESAAGARKDPMEGGGGKGNAGEKPPAPPEGKGNPREKTGEKSQSPNDKGEPMDSSTSDRDSNSAQGNEGSKSGQGEEGGGQKSPQQGEGSEGSNTPSDTGGNTSQDQGKGDNSTKPGDDALSETPTGNPSDTPGDASQSRDGKQGQSSGDQKSSDQSNGDDGSMDDPGQQNDAQNGRDGQGQAGSKAKGNGRRGDSEGDASPTDDRSPGDTDAQVNEAPDAAADEANVEYAREKTDLVLEYLEDQLDNGGVDEELKNKFGWTDEQFREFVRRHNQLRQRAQREGDDGKGAREDLNDSLRSLGLRRPKSQVRTGTPTEEKAPELRDFNRVRFPSELQEYQEGFDAFRKQ